MAGPPSASRSRSAAVVVYARKEDTDGKHEHDNGWAVERAGYIERERMLLEELAATRALVGRMLDQQQMLVQTITQLSMALGWSSLLRTQQSHHRHTDPPPDLVIGDDDIFWMSKLHAGLEEKGFHPGDFDMENWVYGVGAASRDGGRGQVALTNCGFYTGEDDMRWWQFGDTTLTALKFYQSCNGLPESGVCDERSWRSLLAQCAPEAEDPQPNDIYGLRLARGPGGSDDEDNFEEDMEGVSNGRVWLLGEQRWEKRS
eukprot:XP_001703631.1 potential peptidoglycan binding protein [Chlamydomonas reinhardtii]